MGNWNLGTLLLDLDKCSSFAPELFFYIAGICLASPTLWGSGILTMTRLAENSHPGINADGDANIVVSAFPLTVV